MDDPTAHVALARDPFESDTDRRRLAREAASGKTVRLRRGAYYPAEVWRVLSSRQQYRVRIAAVAATRRSKPLFSHQSAAALWGLPSLKPWPEQVHVTVSPSIATRSRDDLVRHSASLSDDDVIDMGDFYVTSIPRTVLDLAATSPFIEAVTVADRALLVDRLGRRAPMTTREELEAAWERSKPIRAFSRVRAVLGFAVTQSESPLESVSRVNIRVAGLPRPQLQVPHYDSAGFIGNPDFTWLELGLLGEADGDVKYLDPEVRSGKSAEQVVLEEKIREDRLRALPRRMSRWRWRTAISPALLRRKLTDAGLTTGHKW